MGGVSDDQAERIARAKAGDARAFEALLAPLVGPAFRLAMTMLNDRGAAEDAVQESALKAWRHLGQFRAGSSLRAWVLTIVANECRSVRRARWWQVQRPAGILRRPERGGPGGGRVGLRAALRRVAPQPIPRPAVYYPLG